MVLFILWRRFDKPYQLKSSVIPLKVREVKENSAKLSHSIPFQSVVSDQKEEHSTTDVMCDEVEWYPSELYFTQIGAMYSYLIALDKDGKLHRWSWDSEPILSDQVRMLGGLTRLFVLTRTDDSHVGIYLKIGR